MPDLERAARLRQARAAAGYARPGDAIAAFQWRRSTYDSHENGNRGISRDRLEDYSRAFRVSLDWLAYGRGSMRAGRQTVRIEGDVVEHGTIRIRREREEIEEIECPAGHDPSEFTAYRVSGNSNFPVWEDGDVILARQPETGPEACIGRRCVVKLDDGTQLIRRLQRGTAAGLFMLLSYSLPPMEDVAVTEAAPIDRVILNGAPRK